jgi:hypothetical protein
MQMCNSFKSAIRKSQIRLYMHGHKHPLRENTWGYWCETYWTASDGSHTTASSGRNLYYLLFSSLLLSYRQSLLAAGCTTACKTSSIQIIFKWFMTNLELMKPLTTQWKWPPSIFQTLCKASGMFLWNSFPITGKIWLLV